MDRDRRQLEFDLVGFGPLCQQAGLEFWLEALTGR
jgi:hypothetical protein